VSIVLTIPRWGLLDVGRNRGLPERLCDQQLEDLVSGLHPAPPLGNDRELETAGVLVELADQRVDPAGVEGRPVQAVERGENSDVGWIAAEGAAADLRELLDVVGADVPRARLEGHDISQLRRRYLLGHHANQGPVTVGDRGDHTVDDRHRGSDQRRFDTGVESLEQDAQTGADDEPKGHLERAQAEQTEERAADRRGEQRLVGAVDQTQQPAEQRHQQTAGEDALPERLDLGPAPGHRGDHLGGCVHRGTDHGADAGPDPVDCIAYHRARCSAQRYSPDRRVAELAGTAPPASVRINHSGVSPPPEPRLSIS
jgi:hypothetical protein